MTWPESSMVMRARSPEGRVRVRLVLRCSLKLTPLPGTQSPDGRWCVTTGPTSSGVWFRRGAGNPRGVDVVVIVLLVLAAVCFGAAAANLPARVNLVALGLLAWLLTVLVPAVAAMG